MSDESFLPPELGEYLHRHALREPPVLARLRRETAEMEHAQMQISPFQGAVMAFLVRLLGARKALEIGVFTGYSSLAVALALPADGRLVACDVSEEWTRVARRYWREAGVEERIDLRLAPALDTLDALVAAGEGGSFDFAFVDADKTGYAAYYERCLELLRPGGLVAVDNVLWSGKVADPTVDDADTRALRELVAAMRDDERIDFAVLPMADGIALGRKRRAAP